MTQAEFNSSLAEKLPKKILEGPCWMARNHFCEIFVVPVAGSSLWHYGCLFYKTAELKCSDLPLSLPLLARAIHRCYSDIPESKWAMDDDYSPVELTDPNPITLKPPTVPKWVVPMRRRGVEKGFVYFFFSRTELTVKIGWATNPRSRLRSVQTGCPHKLQIAAVIPNQTMKDERTIHERFKKYHQRGEWYRYEGELADYIFGLHKESKACPSKSTR